MHGSYNQRMKSLIATILGVILCAFAVAQSTPARAGEGDEWLSWTPVQRTAYVGGFIDGYLGGFLRACQQSDQLFEPASRIVWVMDIVHRTSHRHVAFYIAADLRYLSSIRTVNLIGARIRK